MTAKTEKAAEAALDRENEEIDQPAEVDPHDDKTLEFRTLGFTRMRFDWSPEDQMVMSDILAHVEDRMMVNFTDAYQILNALYDLVREPEVDDDGVIKTDRHGWPVWAQNEYGGYIEDYSRLGYKERDDFLQKITTRLFDWEQRGAEAWTEAMFAKAEWEQRYAHAFMDDSRGGRKTDEAMTQRARTGSREERYFALFLSGYSKKCDALIKSMERISLRLSQINSAR